MLQLEVVAVVSEPDDGITLGCKRLQREEFWYRELCTIYPYGLRVLGTNNQRLLWNVFNCFDR